MRQINALDRSARCRDGGGGGLEIFADALLFARAQGQDRLDAPVIFARQSSADAGDLAGIDFDGRTIGLGQVDQVRLERIGPADLQFLGTKVP